MSGDSSEAGGLFSKKGLRPDDVKLCIINKYDREQFFQNLVNYGWSQVEDPFEFERDWSEKKIRKAAREHSAEVHADLLVEIKDRDYSTNPFNDYVYYVWRSGPNSRGLPPPPTSTQTPISLQMQMLEEQQKALIQQQQMLQRMQMQRQAPPTPQGVPGAQVCPRCGNAQIQFMADGMAKCIKCGYMYRWQGGPPQPGQPQMQPQPMPQQPMPQQPMPQGQPPQQQPQVQAQVPQVQPPVQPGAPTPPGSRQCPKCAAPLNVFPDGSFLCQKCGYTGK